MTIYFGSSTDEEFIDELKQRGYCAIKYPEAKTANKLSNNEIFRLVHENFGSVPRDAWANSVLELRDSILDEFGGGQ